MAGFAPAGEIYQAGTLSGNPIAVSAGIATLRKLRETDAFSAAESAAYSIVSGIKDAPGRACSAVSCGTMFCLFLSPEPPRNYEEVKRIDASLFASYFGEMLERGVYLPPSLFESCFTSSCHGEREVDHIVDAHRSALREGK